MRLRCSVAVLAIVTGVSFAGVVVALADERDDRPRLLVLTDIGGDPDDQQSLVRLLHYANEFEIEGLIASAAGTRGELNAATTRSDLIREIVLAYGEVQPNLAKHAPGYPTANDLNATMKTGNPLREWSAVGAEKDTEGSNWIIERGDAKDDRPLNVVIWGGQTDFAQALWRVREDRGEEGLARFISKLRVYDINDQDGIAERIWKEFPGLFYVLASAYPGKDKRTGCYRGMYLGGDESLVSRDWMETNIRTHHGPLGALYPPNTWTEPNPYGAIKEGDTPSWFYFLPTGLNDSAHPEWGGWGGRFAKNEQGIWRDAADTVDGVSEPRATVFRWREAYQNDFAARLDWGVTEKYEDANHPPVVVLNGDKSRGVVQVEARAGERLKLLAEGTTDPDGDELSVTWYVYGEPSSYAGPIEISSESGDPLDFDLEPSDLDKSGTIHVVLEVRDSGEPPLISYRRAVMDVRGE